MEEEEEEEGRVARRLYGKTSRKGEGWRAQNHRENRVQTCVPPVTLNAV